MLLIQGSSRLRELIIVVILATVFSQFGFMVLLYTVPLYTLYYRRGASDLLLGAGIVLFLMLILAAWRNPFGSRYRFERSIISYRNDYSGNFNAWYVLYH